MWIVFFILAILAFAYGASIMAIAESAVHEIEAFILFLIGAVFITGAAVVEAVNVMRKKLGESLNRPKTG